MKRDSPAASIIITTLVAAIFCSPGVAHGQSSGVVVMRRGPVDSGLAGRIETIVSGRRSVLPLKSLPAESRSPEELANEERVKAIAIALGRAQKHEEVAAWDACVKESGDQLGPATELLATSGKLDLLRDLHVQIGSCMSLAGQLADAMPHFRKASLLDESPPPKGMHREEAELARDQARDEVVRREKGPVRIETDPPGAEVWIDGRRAKGVTPLSIDVRLGQHFVTLRRFRHEAQTTQTMMQPKSAVRFALEGARRDTLREQLGEIRAGARSVADDELDLAKALWAGADQIVLLSKPPGPSVAIRVSLVDAASGRSVRGQTIPTAAEDEELRRSVCGVLGEECPDEPGVNPHLIWPFAVVAAIGTAIAIGFIVDSQRETVFCPMDGC
jgi:hypothetical protein